MVTPASINTLSSVSAASLSDRVFEQIKSAIVDGELPQGTKLTEDDLAQRYGVSRGPLREAIRKLESLQLIVRIPRSGMHVVRVTRQMMRELYEVREVLEGLAARVAAESMPEHEINELHALLNRHETHIRQHRGKTYLLEEGDLDFHIRIARASRNEWLSDLLGSKIYQLLRMCRQRSSKAPDRPLRALEEHRRVLEAIENRDPQLAELLMRRHINGSWKLVAPLLPVDESNTEKLIIEREQHQ